MSLPKHLQKRLNPKTTRERSNKQEKSIAQELGGRTEINSGATFGTNDVTTKDFEVEAKTTYAKSFSIKKDYWLDVVDKCDVNKIPLMQVDFENLSNPNDPTVRLAVIGYDDLLMLINNNLTNR